MHTAAPPPTQRAPALTMRRRADATATAHAMRGRGAAAELAARSHLLAARLHLLATWADEHWRRAERRGVEAFELRPGRRVDPHRIVAARAARLAVARPEADSQPATGESARVIYLPMGGIYTSAGRRVEIDWIASERNVVVAYL